MIKNGTLTSCLIELVTDLAQWPEALAIVGAKLNRIINADTAYETNRKRKKRAAKKAVPGKPSDGISMMISSPVESAHSTLSTGEAKPPAPKPEKALIPADWTPTREACEAIIDGGFPGELLISTADEFRDRMAEELKTSGDWSSTFRRWCRQAVRQGWTKPRSFLPPERRKKKATGHAGGDSRALPSKRSAKAKKPSETPTTAYFWADEESPEFQAWQKDHPGKAIFERGGKRGREIEIEYRRFAA